MLKRILSLSLSLLLLLMTFVSCTNTDDHAKETDSTPDTSAIEDTRTSEEEESFKTPTEEKETPIMTPTSDEYTEYLSTVEYLDFELTGDTSPYFMGRWYQRKLLALPHMFTVTDGSMLYFLIDGAESFDVVFTDMQLLFYNMIPFSQRNAENIKSVVKDYENIHLVETDTWNVSYSDGIHPNAKGAKNAGERLADALVSIFGKDFFD